MTRRTAPEYKANVMFLTTTSYGDYYVVADKTRVPAMVKRTRYATTVCLHCPSHPWEGTVTLGGETITNDGCKHTNLVEYALEKGVIPKASDTSSLSAALDSIPDYLEVEEPERGAVPE